MFLSEIKDRYEVLRRLSSAFIRALFKTFIFFYTSRKSTQNLLSLSIPAITQRIGQAQ